MHLAQDNDVIHAFTPDRSDQSLGNAVLPRRGWCGGLVPDAHGAQSARDDAAIDPVAIADDAARPKVDFRRSSAGSTRAALCRSAVALRVGATSNASSSQSRPCANAPTSRAG